MAQTEHVIFRLAIDADRQCPPVDAPGTSLGWSTTTSGSRRAARPPGRDVSGCRVDHEPVYPRREYRRCPSATLRLWADRHQHQPLTQLFARLGKSRNKIQRGRVAERIGERFGDHQAHCPGPAGAQRSRHRIGSGIADALGRGEHFLRSSGGELIGPVVRIEMVVRDTLSSAANDARVARRPGVGLMPS